MRIAPKPSLRLRKSVCWLLLFASLGTIVFFLLIILQEGVKHMPRGILFLPIFAVLATAVSGIVLRRSYRAEPANFAGFWHLSLVDLWAATFFSALLMFIFRAIWPKEFVPVGMVITVVLGLGFAFCLMLAARKGCVDMRLKILYAMGYFWGSLGWMVVGMFASVLAFITFFQGEFHEAVRAVYDLFNLAGGSPGDGTLFDIVRAGILCIPLGYALRKYVDGRLAIQRATLVAHEAPKGLL